MRYKNKVFSKQKGLLLLCIIYNYILLNKYIIKIQYLIYQLEKTIDIIIKPGFKIFF